jgi:WD40-like Beta Propeller Repeat
MHNRSSRGPGGLHPCRSAGLLAVLLSSACAHQDPFPSGEVPDGGPRSTTPPVQLTLSTGPDLDPAWLADGRGLAYSFRQDGDPDRCLGVLPPAGGTRRSEKCVRNDPGHDSVDALTETAAGPAGRAAWVDFRSLNGRIAPDAGALRVGTLAPGDTGIPVRTLPYLAPSGAIHATATHLGWLDADRLAYIGSDVFYERACQGCKLDTIVVAREAMLLDLSLAQPMPQTIPGTTQATSLWPGGDGTSIYYSLAGDSRVYRQILATGDVSLVHDFGALGIARAVTVRGTTLVAVVGGRVAYLDDPLLGTVQRDDGGPLIAVDLNTGAETRLPFGTSLARRAALAPDGVALAVEGYDTLAATLDPNLWLLVAP